MASVGVLPRVVASSLGRIPNILFSANYFSSFLHQYQSHQFPEVAHKSLENICQHNTYHEGILVKPTLTWNDSFLKPKYEMALLMMVYIHLDDTCEQVESYFILYFAYIYTVLQI